ETPGVEGMWAAGMWAERVRQARTSALRQLRSLADHNLDEAGRGFERLCRGIGRRDVEMRILVVGAGVIGSVYAARLLEAGHTVMVCARGRRLAELRDGGLVLEDAETGRRTAHKVDAVATPDGVACNLVLVAVRRDQMIATVPLLANV